MTQDPNPQEALASIQSARDSVAAPTDYPIGYDVLYGVLCAMIVAGQGMPLPWALITLVVAIIGLGASIRWWRKEYGWWVSGYSPKRARWVAYGMAALFTGLIGLSLYGRHIGPDWLYLVSGAIGFVGAIVGNRLWMKVWRKEMAEAPK